MLSFQGDTLFATLVGDIHIILFIKERVYEDVGLSLNVLKKWFDGNYNIVRQEKFNPPERSRLTRLTIRMLSFR